jgi:Ca2+-binding RTX toxin-like protein
MTPVQRRRLALGVAVLGLLAVGTALQTPPEVGPRDCVAGLVVGAHRAPNGRLERACLLRAAGGTVVVSRVGKGPRRGKVISLAAARGRYSGGCVANPGRAYVVIPKGTGQVQGSNASERMVGFERDDSFDGKLGDDCIDGGPGNDTAFGRGGGDVLFGGTGDDQLSGGGGSDSIHGGDGNDGLSGGPGGDSLYGGAGNDTISAGPGGDVISAGPGDDVISAPRPGMRSLNCGPGRDQATVNTVNRAKVHNCEVVRLVAG